MDENVVSVLENILYYCERIESFKRTFGNDIEDFLNNDAYNMSCAFSLMQIGECVKKISQWLCSENNNVEWNKVCRFRDFIAHNYGKVDNVVVWNIIDKHLPILNNEIKSLLDKYNH